MISFNRFVLLATFSLLFINSAMGVAPASYKRLIVFGDSLSDVGTYSLVSKSYGGGKFTTNPGKLWVELVADGLGLPMKPNRLEGYGYPSYFLGGFNYAQGGARVTIPKSVNPNSKEGSARPVVEQTQLFLQQFHGFLQSDLVFVQGGANDVFAQIAGLKAGKISPAEAIQNMIVAANELSVLLKNLNRQGASNLFVVNLPMIEKTPLVLEFDPQFQGLVEKMVLAFNATLKAGTRSSGVKLVDFYSFELGMGQRSLQYGFKNVTIPACNVKLLPSNSSLYCSSKTLIEPDADKTFKYADSVHPSTAFSGWIGRFVFSEIQRLSLTR